MPLLAPRSARFDTLNPLCSSTHAAACSSSSTFAGQRPDGAEPVDWALIVSAELVKDTALLPPYILDFGQVSTVVTILHPSTLIAPVPCARTFLATVFSARGLRASTTGSWPGFNAVPQPSHCTASGVAGAVTSTTCCPPCLPSANSPVRLVGCLALPVILLPITSRSAPASLSIAFPTSCDLGNPDAYSHAWESRISNAASSIATASRCPVFVLPTSAMCPPGLSTR